MSKFRTMFGDRNPEVIVVHLGAHPGGPSHDQSHDDQAAADRAKSFMKAARV